MSRLASERAVVFLVGAVQFVNILDFLMVMPLGPDFAIQLGIPTSELGRIGGSYTAAAALAGVAGSVFLDRFDRRKALAVAMAGLGLGTLAGGLATGLRSLIAARLLAGLFGGPATSLALSIIADVVPSERRGKAMGAVMGAFSIASVLGVPGGLELARTAGWRSVFFAVGTLGALVTTGAIVLLPPMRGHLRRGSSRAPPLRKLLARPRVRASYAMTALVMGGGFLLIPNISAYVQGNLAYPRDRLGLLYLFGGLASFASMRVAGPLVDRLGSFRVGSAAALGLAGVLYLGFVRPAPLMPLSLVFVTFMTAMAFRNVAYHTLTSKVPSTAERAQFMSLQSAVTHLAAATGAIGSSYLLRELPGHVLEGMPRLATMSVLLTLCIPLFFHRVERMVKEGR